MNATGRGTLAALRAAVLSLAFWIAPAGQGGAQEIGIPPIRVVFLGGDGQVLQLPGGLLAGPAAAALLDAEIPPLTLERRPLGRGALGVTVIDLTRDLRRHYGAPADRGVMVSSIVPGSPAEVAGLRVADIVAGIDDGVVRDADGFRGEVRARRAGDEVVLDVWRDGKPLGIRATVEERERPLVRLQPIWIAPKRLEVRVNRIDRPAQQVRIEVDELIDQLERVLESGPKLADPVLEVRGATRTNIERRMRELEREIEELDRRLRAARVRED